MRNIHIICIKFGNKYSSEYVDKLFRGIKRNTSKSFSFTCFTDNSGGIQHIAAINTPPLPMNTGDWYSKIGLYNKELYSPEDQIFYFDLDTVIVNNLDEIFEYDGEFICLQDFYRAKGFGSGLMSWRPASANFLYESYPRDYKCRNGDQGWIELKYKNPDLWQQVYPGKVISYKVHIKNKGKVLSTNHTSNPGNLDTASIVCFHGRPLPHEINENWMKNHWI